MNSRFLRIRTYSLPIDKLEMPLASFNLSGIRSVLATYLLTFGLYGYGSDLEIQEPLTFLPLFAGLLVSIYFFLRPSGFFDRWNFRAVLKFKHVLVYLGVFAALVLSSHNTLENEQVGDELSYVQFAVVHSLELAELLTFLDQASPVGPLLQLLSLALVLLFILPMLLFIALAPLRATIVVVAITVTAFQIVYSTLGGWGWGYTKVAWFPYLLPVSIFGADSNVFRITSLAIVAIGFTALFFTLRALSISLGLRAITVLTLVALPIPALYYSSLDHIVYFIAIAIPITVYLFARPSNQILERVFLILAIGSLFRITIGFLLIALSVWVLVEKPYRNGILKLWNMTQPALLIIVPYVGGVLVATPLFSSLGETSSELELNPQQVANILEQQVGFFETLITTSVVLISLIYSRARFPLMVFLGTAFSFYFVILAPTGLVGEARYSVEWAVSLFLIALATLGIADRANRNSFLPRVVSRLALTTVVALVLFSNQSLLRDVIYEHPNSSDQNLNSYRPIGYLKVQNFLVESQVRECVPVGVVYGAGNEILANRPLGVVKFARKAHLELQAAQKATSRDWTSLSGSVASASRFRCLYGSRSAFLGLNDRSWDGWDIAFSAGDFGTGLTAVVLRR